jgi:hypothetical protein
MSASCRPAASPEIMEDTMRPIGYAAFGLYAAVSMTALLAPPALAQTAPPVIMPQVVTVPPVVIVAPTAPPAAQVEVIPAPPIGQEKSIVWQPGRWTWANGAWAWTAGAYVMRPSASATWIPGRWELQPNGSYVWQDGRWG